ncbi:MAG: SRPBCC domain-containing protein [Gammaproteobacteria bacterium]|nr:SRPBCC domain-containing protein [Gammaproteobacteria bacterium]
MSTVSPVEKTLKIRRIFNAPREKIFSAWTDPEELKQWWGPPGYTAPSVEIDLRVGGSFRVAMQAPDGGISNLIGIYRVVTPPEKLVYTWNWESGSACDGEDGPVGETLVTVEFRDLGGDTEVIVTHDGLPDEKAWSGHNEGWSSSLDRLEALFSN